MGDENWDFGGYGVQIEFCGVCLVGKLRVVVAKSDDPFPLFGRGTLQPVFDERGEFFSGAAFTEV